MDQARRNTSHSKKESLSQSAQKDTDKAYENKSGHSRPQTAPIYIGQSRNSIQSHIKDTLCDEVASISKLIRDTISPTSQ